MSDAIQVVDPGDADAEEPVAGLTEQTAFAVGGYRLALVETRGESAWHAREGTVHGWVRAGRGRLEHAGGTARLEPGDFLRVPAATPVRYLPGDESLDLLAVVEGTGGVTAVDGPGGGRSGAGPEPGDDAGAGPERGADRPAVVGPDELVETVASPNLARETPFPGGDVLPMRVRAAGGAAAGWHHHGENVYFGYAVDGPSETEYGPGGSDVARIEIGECFHVPPGLVHRDTNPTDQAHTGIIWLCGGEPWVVNVDGPASG